MKRDTKINILAVALTIVLMMAFSSVAETGGTTATATYGEGTFEVGLTPISNKYCVVSTKGECDGQTVEVEVLLEDENADYIPDPGQPAIEGTAWENAIFSAGTMTIRGNGDFNEVAGTLHANGLMKVSGNVDLGSEDVHMSSSTKIMLNGNVNSSGSFTAEEITVTGNKDGSATYSYQEVSQKAFPEYDLTELYNTALANGQVIDGNVNTQNATDWSNVPGGVKWINGYLKVNANANLDCIVVATGSINITGNVNWGQQYTGTHIISRDSSIKVGGNAEINGLLYAPGDITLSGTAHIEGQVVSGSDVVVNGNVDVINYSYAGPDHPGIDGGNPLAPSIKIGAWQK